MPPFFAKKAKLASVDPTLKNQPNLESLILK